MPRYPVTVAELSKEIQFQEKQCYWLCNGEANHLASGNMSNSLSDKIRTFLPLINIGRAIRVSQATDLPHHLTGASRM